MCHNINMLGVTALSMMTDFDRNLRLTNKEKSP